MKKIISKLLLVSMLVCSVFASGAGTQAAEVKAGTTRAIYVVFDNSGSMYGPGNKAWSQAIYAMEVFAAMMNFDSGDQMKIFPMSGFLRELKASLRPRRAMRRRM